MWGESQRSFESLADLDASLDVKLQGKSQSRPNVVFLWRIIIIVFRQRIYFQQSRIVIQIWVGAIASRSGVASGARDRPPARRGDRAIGYDSIRAIASTGVTSP
jgi:hypothetical protein